MMEYSCFDFSPFGVDEKASSLEDFVTSPRFTSPCFTSPRFTSPVQSRPVCEYSMRKTSRACGEQGEGMQGRDSPSS